MTLRLPCLLVTGLALSMAGVARAEVPPGGDTGAASPGAAAAPAPGSAPAADTAAPAAAPDALPAPTETGVPAAPEPSALDAAPPLAGTLGAEASTRHPSVSYGAGARLRWVSVPKWMLGLFTKKNMPLSSWASAVEFFRRKGEFDFMVSIGYQRMSPDDGNWLGKGHDAAIDTDYVQFKDLAFWGVDASFVWHTMFTDWFGMHYGAGLGVGIITGQMLRTSNGTNCTEANAGNVDACHPIGAICANGVCTDASLMQLGPGIDDPAKPHRFVDGNVPPAIPIVNVVVGFDFKVPRIRGWEARIEGGFYDAFFVGMGVGYTF
jgi:hypothetical protein